MLPQWYNDTNRILYLTNPRFQVSRSNTFLIVPLPGHDANKVGATKAMQTRDQYSARRLTAKRMRFSPRLVALLIENCHTLFLSLRDQAQSSPIN